MQPRKKQQQQPQQQKTVTEKNVNMKMQLMRFHNLLVQNIPRQLKFLKIDRSELKFSNITSQILIFKIICLRKILILFFFYLDITN